MAYDPQTPDWRKQAAGDDLLAAAVFFFEQGDASRSLAVLEALLALRRGTPTALFLYAVCLARLGRAAHASEALQLGADLLAKVPESFKSRTDLEALRAEAARAVFLARPAG